MLLTPWAVEGINFPSNNNPRSGGPRYLYLTTPHPRLPHPKSQQGRDAGAEDVPAVTLAREGEGKGEVDGDGGFAEAALGGGDGDGAGDVGEGGIYGEAALGAGDLRGRRFSWERRGWMRRGGGMVVAQGVAQLTGHVILEYKEYLTVPTCRYYLLTSL